MSLCAKGDPAPLSKLRFPIGGLARIRTWKVQSKTKVTRTYGAFRKLICGHRSSRWRVCVSKTDPQYFTTIDEDGYTRMKQKSDADSLRRSGIANQGDPARSAYRAISLLLPRSVISEKRQFSEENVTQSNQTH